MIILHLDSGRIAKFKRALGMMGYRFQFVSLPAFHAIKCSVFQLAHGCRHRGMEACAELQEAEFASENHGYSATKYQHEVVTRYDLAHIIAVALSSTVASRGSTGHEQFH